MKVPVRSPQPSLAGGIHGAGHPSDLPGVPPTATTQGSTRRPTPAGDGADTNHRGVCAESTTGCAESTTGCAESTTGCAPSLAAPTHPVDPTPAAETSPSAAGGSGQDPR